MPRMGSFLFRVTQRMNPGKRSRGVFEMVTGFRSAGIGVKRDFFLGVDVCEMT